MQQTRGIHQNQRERRKYRNEDYGTQKILIHPPTVRLRFDIRTFPSFILWTFNRFHSNSKPFILPFYCDTTRYKYFRQGISKTLRGFNITKPQHHQHGYYIPQPQPQPQPHPLDLRLRSSCPFLYHKERHSSVFDNLQSSFSSTMF